MQKKLYRNLTEILTDSFSPAIILPDLNNKIHYSSIRHATQFLQQTSPFCNLNPGELVSLFLPNSIDFVCSFFAIVAVRAIVNPINTTNNLNDTINHLKIVSPRFVITSDTFENFHIIAAACNSLSIPLFKVVVELVPQHWESTSRIIRTISPIASHQIKTVKPVCTITNIGVSTPLTASGDRNAQYQYQDSDIAVLLKTPGTSGDFKLVPLTHDNILESLFNICNSLTLGASDLTYQVMPLYHSYGLIGVLLASFYAGASVILPPALSFDDFWKNISMFKATWYSTTPILHKLILSKLNGKPTPPNSMRFIQTCGLDAERDTVLSLEQVLLKHPAVEEAIFYGVPSVLSGQDIEVAVLLKPKLKVSVSELRQWLEQSIPFCMPKKIHIVRELPRVRINRRRQAAKL
ncbi:hypothetical protein HDV02_006482 [Globomyces sp. JEL0801]|nr:hypothetical protein HDV02_006482 [Globomyces sp. JEL0801]